MLTHFPRSTPGAPRSDGCDMRTHCCCWLRHIPSWVTSPVALFEEEYLSTIFWLFVCIGSGNKHVQYGALYLQIVGSYAAVPCLSTWNANNVQPHYRRATAIAIGVIAPNVGGIVSTWLFDDPPRFRKATRINLAFSVATAVCSVGILIYFRLRNAEKQREVQRLLKTHGEGTGVGGWDSFIERKRLGDRHPRFEFTT